MAKWEKRAQPEGRNCGSFTEITSLKEDTRGDETTPLSQNLYEIRFSISLPGQRNDRSLFSIPSLLLFHRAIPNCGENRNAAATSHKRMQSFRWITGGKGKGVGPRETRGKKVPLHPLRPLGFIYIFLWVRALSRRRAGARIEIAKLSRGKITVCGHFTAGDLADSPRYKKYDKYSD